MAVVADASTSDEPLAISPYQLTNRRVSMASYARRFRAQRYEIGW